MACISPDGSPTETGTKILNALKSGLGLPEEITQNTGVPLFRVRSGLRELNKAGLIHQTKDIHEITEKGAKLIE